MKYNTTPLSTLLFLSIHTHMHTHTHLFLLLYSPGLLQFHWSSNSSHMTTTYIHTYIHIPDIYRFLEGEESLWWRWMARPGDLGISESPPGGESHRSAHDFSARYASVAAGIEWLSVTSGVGGFPYHCMQLVYHPMSRSPVCMGEHIYAVG